MQTQEMGAFSTRLGTFLIGLVAEGWALVCLTDSTRRVFPTKEAAREFAEDYEPAKEHEMN